MNRESFGGGLVAQRTWANGCVNQLPRPGPHVSRAVHQQLRVTSVRAGARVPARAVLSSRAGVSGPHASPVSQMPSAIWAGLVGAEGPGPGRVLTRRPSRHRGTSAPPAARLPRAGLSES